MNKELEKTVNRVIKVNCLLQCNAIEALQNINAVLETSCYDSTHYSDYLNNSDKESLAQLQKSLYNVIKTTTDTIYDLINEK